MKCDEARELLPAEIRRELGDTLHAEVRAHVDTCEACQREEAVERTLSEALELRLPHHKAPPALKRRLGAIVAGKPPTPSPRGWMQRLMPMVAVAAVLALLPLTYENAAERDQASAALLSGETVNDHLRVLEGERPLEIVSGGIHEVKPWFADKIDFAPRVAFAGDEDFPLQGGTVSRFLDRKAATLVYKRRLHTISLFVFRADGLSWPTSHVTRVGHARARSSSDRGFTTIVWRDGDLGYALVSDLDPAELTQLAARFAP
jgi:anti-sigma factor RsiW